MGQLGRVIGEFALDAACSRPESCDPPMVSRVDNAPRDSVPESGGNGRDGRGY